MSKQDAILSAELDWITMTTIEGENAELMVRLGNKLIEREQSQGSMSKDWSGMGYKGIQCGAVKLGARGTNEAILVVSGGVSNEIVSRETIASFKPTRVDLQVTVRLGRFDGTVAERMYDSVTLQGLNGGTKRATKLIKSPSGETAYIGKRSSAIFLRCYDRSLAMGEATTGRIWRYEVEYKKNAAAIIYRKMEDLNWDSPAIASQVFSEFVKRGADPEFEVVQTISAIEVGRSVTDAEGKLKWLEKCVAPAIVQLCLAGYESEVFSSLSLRGVSQAGRKHNGS